MSVSSGVILVHLFNTGVDISNVKARTMAILMSILQEECGNTNENSREGWRTSIMSLKEFTLISFSKKVEM